MERVVAAHGQTRIEAQKAKTPLHVSVEVLGNREETQREASAYALPLQGAVLVETSYISFDDRFAALLDCRFGLELGA